jgi:tol-pal system protein YbgF
MAEYFSSKPKLGLLSLLSLLLIQPLWAAEQGGKDNSRNLEDISGMASDADNSQDYQLLSDFEERIEALEEDVKSLRGSLEEVSQKIETRQNSIEKSVESINKRLKDIETKLEQNGSKKEANNKSNESKQKTGDKSEDKKEKLARIQKEYNEALSQLKDKNYEKSAELFKQFISRYQGDPLLSNAYFWYGESFYRRENYEKAAIYYLKGYNLFPKGAKASDSLLKLSYSLYYLGKKDKACDMLRRLDNEFPERPNSAKNRANELYNKIGCKAPKKAPASSK